MAKDDDPIFPGLDGVNPRVALLGPKGGGKTMFRHFLATEKASFPVYLQTALGVRDLGFGRKARRIAWKPSEKTWHEREDFLPPAETRKMSIYLPKVSGTTDLTVHRLPLPTLRKGVHAELLDFPGEYWSRDESLDDPTAPQRDACVLRALDHCKIVVIIMPYWLLVPWSLRVVPPPHILDVARKAKIAKIAEENEIDIQVAVMMSSLNDWLERMRTMLDRSRRHRPMVLVSFSMLSSSWGDEIVNDDETRHLRGLLGEMRGLALASGQVRSWRIPSWMSFFAQPVVHVEAASRLRQVMARLDAKCRDFVTEALELELQHASGTSGPARRIYDMLVDRPNTHVRFTAMNVVSERAWLLPNPGSRSRRQYFRMKQAGAMLPLVYLAANLDRLA